ncbi:MAG: SdiA-regulated domain-containing protein [Saprospiraceae bacterium]|nr:SdiA-regulated domain-containing protein [Saprospiraceae bacterium]
MFKNKLLLFILFIYSLETKAQVSLTELCKLDEKLHESSGLVYDNSSQSFWTIVDSDGQPKLYEIDTTCQILRTLIIKNAANIDWEEITLDSEGNLYIGDFGNNSNNRKDQRIYKIKKSDYKNSDEVSPEIIDFHYSDQTEFPPEDINKNYDMEAMIWLNHNIYLFSKNRTNPFSGYTYQYRIPDSAGSYAASRIDSFYTGSGPSLFFWITGAAISPDFDQLCLLTHDKIWLFHPLNKEKLFSSPVKRISLGHFSQKEGVSYMASKTIFITDEYNSMIRNGGRLYRVNLESVLSLNNLNASKKSGILYLRDFIELGDEPIDLLEIINLEGRRILSLANIQSGQLRIDQLQRGLYFIKLQSQQLLKNIPFFKE